MLKKLTGRSFNVKEMKVHWEILLKIGIEGSRDMILLQTLSLQKEWIQTEIQEVYLL